MNQAAQEGDVTSGANWRVEIGVSGGACVARVDVDNLRAALARFHDKAKANRMAFRHIGTLNHNTIAIDQVPLRSRGSATSQADAQTGHR